MWRGPCDDVGMKDQGVPWGEIGDNPVVAHMDEDPEDLCMYTSAYEVNPGKPLSERRLFIRQGDQFVEVDPALGA